MGRVMTSEHTINRVATMLADAIHDLLVQSLLDLFANELMKIHHSDPGRGKQRAGRDS
jgi:hypothetical protein